MRKIKCFILLLLLCIVGSFEARAQTVADALQQLAIDYQKLAGLKSILQKMYQGYEVISKGYGTVQDISKGNFDLHDAFLNGLMIVSPTVRKYPRVADIIEDQATLVKEYKTAYGAFSRDKNFKPEEISYLLDVYNSLVSQSLQNLDELAMVVTDSKLRMSDNERLQLIDHIYSGGHDQLTFLRNFNDHTRQVALQRARANNDNVTIQKLYGIQ